MPLPAKKTGFTFNHIDQPDNLGEVTGNAAIVKQKLDSRGEELRVLVNALIDAHNSTTVDDSGAHNVKSAPIAGLTGDNVYALLSSIVTVLKAVTDGSSGADFVGATAIAGLEGATVQALLEALKGFIDTHKSSADHDGRYNTKTELAGGALDTRYFTETELTDGALDTRYYTETELTNGALDTRYRTENELSASTGAALVGVTPPTGISGSNVQQVVNSLKSAIDSTALGQIPDGSLTTAKLADGAVTSAKLASDVNTQIANAPIITDVSTGAKYKWGVDNGALYIEVVS